MEKDHAKQAVNKGAGEKPAQKSKVALREEGILAFWKDKQIFEKSLAKEAPKGRYVFYDGPPFATGLPHYGHILGSTIKDAVPRYQTMRGKYVERRWGWDCHGLPIENIVEKDLGISGKQQIEEYGVDKFNEYARSKVLTYVHEWKKTVERIGRWVDFDGSYKTMDNSYIESVWWALKEIHDKGLLYEGTRVLPYCPRCETPIANSEIAMDNSYKDINDISAYVEFELKDTPKTFLIAWTTTPWTLPGNFALAINPTIEYVAVEGEVPGNTYIVAKARLEAVFGMNAKILRDVPAAELVGKSYTPPFAYFTEREFKGKENAWKIYPASFVTTDSGSGIVHIAPGYGEDDMNLAKEQGIPFIHHVGPDGKFTKDVTDFAGQKVKPKPTKEEPKLHQSGDVAIIKYLAAHDTLFKKELITHSYPHCFRCETPLFYYAIPAWFIKISDVKEKIVALNEKINWIPEHLKEGRFRKSVEGAPDWNISRNRYWASPLPIWKCEHCKKIEIISSLDEIKKKTSRGNNYFLVRHGEAEQNLTGVVSYLPTDQNHLTEKGKEQVGETAEMLVGKKIDMIFASDLVRTKETAEIIRKRIGLAEESIIFDSRLREFNIGVYQGKNWGDYEKEYPFNDAFEKTPEGGETLSDVRKRAGDFLFEIDKKYEGKNILIVSHRAPIRMLHAVAEGVTRTQICELKDKGEWTVQTGSVSNISFAPFPHNKDYELDFHRPYIDDISWKCSCEKGEAKRIPEVIDCWFESGSMPFAANHFPFEKKEWFKENFPAQFISEYIAQTRTWFYYTAAVSAMLFGDIPFENVVTTGTILAEDGSKMSKSKNNFSDPATVFDKYGVDALRYHLLSSPLMKSEDLNFSDKDVDEVYKKVIARLDNVVSFYLLYEDKNVLPNDTSKNTLDRWILALLSKLAKEVTDGMETYEIEKAVRPFDAFIEDLSTWYLRRSRDRFKSEHDGERKDALATMRFVLLELSKLMAPFTPFMAEDIYQKVWNGLESVHLENWPTLKLEKGNDEELIQHMKDTRTLVSLGLEARAKAGIKVRQPLAKISVKIWNLADDFADLIKDEVNVKEVVHNGELAESVILDTHLTPELQEEGDMRELIRGIQEARKNAKLEASQKVKLIASVPESHAKLLKKFNAEISSVCGLTEVDIQPEKEGMEMFSFV